MKVLVVGDLMMDHYIWGSCDRISPEAPVQVVATQSESKRLGGAGNVVANLIELGACVSIASVLGADKTGDEIVDMLELLGADTALIMREKGRTSGLKSRVMASHQQVVRIDSESVGDVLCAKDFIALIEKKMAEFDIVLLSDYAKGVLSDEVCASIIALANKFNKMVLADPKGKDYLKYSGATLLTPNKKEASLATGINITDHKSLKAAITKLKDEINLKYGLITLSEEGIALLDDSLEIFPAIAKEVFDVTGAGDTVLATLGYMLANKADIKQAVKIANLAAAVVVAKVGSATASFSEIEELLRAEDSTHFERKIKSLDSLQDILAHKGEKRLVFTNGCFDILHPGHVRYLSKARDFGDILVVGLNSDDSVRRLKGQSRPINSQDDRACLLAALGFVDFVVIFDEDTPLNLIKALKPDILVKGADYADKKVVGADIVGDVRLVEFEAGKSTTGIIQRIKDANR